MHAKRLEAGALNKQCCLQTRAGSEKAEGECAEPWQSSSNRGNMCVGLMRALMVPTNSSPMKGFGEGGREVCTTASKMLHATSATLAALRAYC